MKFVEKSWADPFTERNSPILLIKLKDELQYCTFQAVSACLEDIKNPRTTFPKAVILGNKVTVGQAKMLINIWTVNAGASVKKWDSRGQKVIKNTIEAGNAKISIMG